MKTISEHAAADLKDAQLVKDLCEDALASGYDEYLIYSGCRNIKIGKWWTPFSDGFRAEIPSDSMYEITLHNYIITGNLDGDGNVSTVRAEHADAHNRRSASIDCDMELVRKFANLCMQTVKQGW